MIKKKNILKPTPEPVVEKTVTYRLSLMDSENRAVQIDLATPNSPEIDLEDIQKLLDTYHKLLESEAEYKISSEEHDKEVEVKQKEIQKEKHKALEAHKCEACGEEWRGGSDRCPVEFCQSNAEVVKD